MGRLRAPDDLVDQLDGLRFTGLDVTIDHALAVGRLPDHHTDPFDRLLIAQARIGGLMVVTRDPSMARYDVETLAA